MMDDDEKLRDSGSKEAREQYSVRAGHTPMYERRDLYTCRSFPDTGLSVIGDVGRKQACKIDVQPCSGDAQQRSAKVR